MYVCRRQFEIFLAVLIWSAQTFAANAGWRQVQLPGATPDAPAITVALYCPTSMPERAISMGPFTARVAIQAPPDPQPLLQDAWLHAQQHHDHGAPAEHRARLHGPEPGSAM